MLSRFASEYFALRTTPISRRKRISIWMAYVWLMIRNIFRRSADRAEGSTRFMGARIKYYTRSNLVGIVREVFVRGDYYFKPANETPFIIDCGANIGMASMYFAYLYPKARILALEPGPEAFGRLTDNVKANPIFKNVTCLNVAASGRDGTEDFFENTKSAGGSTLNPSIAESKDLGIFKKMTVKTTKLSSLVTEPVDLLKMDVEGGELVILKELESAGKLPLIKEMVFECHYNHGSTGNSVPEILTLLERNGYLPVISSETTAARFKKTPIYHFIVHAYRM